MSLASSAPDDARADSRERQTIGSEKTSNGRQRYGHIPFRWRVCPLENSIPASVLRKRPPPPSWPAASTVRASPRTLLHPGAVATRLGQNNGRLATALTKLLRPFFRTAEQGAATAIYLASSPAVEGVSGKYFVDCREARSSGVSYDESLARRLWDASARLSGIE